MKNRPTKVRISEKYENLEEVFESRDAQNKRKLFDEMLENTK